MPAKPVLFALLALLALPACEPLIDVELPERPPQLTVNGLFTADTTWAVEVGRSYGPLEGGGRVEIDDATVEILEGGRVVARPGLCRQEGAGSPASFGLYCAPGAEPEPGRTYALRVTAPGFPPLTATDHTPPPVPFTVAVDTLDVVAGPGGRDVDYTVRYTVRFADPPGEPHYYAVSMVLYRPTGPVAYAPIPFHSDHALLLDGSFDGVVSGGEIPSYPGTAWFADAGIDGQAQELVLRVRHGANPASAEVIVELYTLSEAYYRYLRTRRPLTGWDYDLENPFAEPIQIHTNVQNGLGIFAGSSVTRVRLR